MDSHSTLGNMGRIPDEPDIACYHCSYSVWAHWEVMGHFINEGGCPKTLALGFMWGNGGEYEGCRDSRASLSDIFSQWGQISVPWPSSQVEINHEHQNWKTLEALQREKMRPNKKTGLAQGPTGRWHQRLRSRRKTRAPLPSTNKTRL